MSMKDFVQNCYRLVRLINNLIDVTKIDAGYFQLNMSNENIVSLVENITLIFDTDVEEKIIACDTDKIESILLNLISNAVKFTECGGSIFVSLMDTGENVIISVKDTGIGIAKENQNLIFERFIQVDKSFTRNREGSEFIITLPVYHAPSKEESLNTNNFLIHDNVEKINIEFSDIYSSS